MVGMGTTGMGMGIAIGTGNLTHVPTEYTHNHVNPYLLFVW